MVDAADTYIHERRPFWRKNPNDVFLRWPCAVVLNSLSGLLWGLQMGDTSAWAYGLATGIATFIAGYIALDYQLLKQQRFNASRRLFKAAMIKCLLQFLFPLDMFLGYFGIAFASGIIASLEITENPFAMAYVTTLCVGLVYSFVVLFIFAIAHRRRTRSSY